MSDYNERDYEGDMSYFQNQLLRKKGITKKMYDMDRFIGLTRSELQGIVDSIQLTHDPICNCPKCNAAVMKQGDWGFDEEEKAPTCLNCGAFLNLPEGY